MRSGRSSTTPLQLSSTPLHVSGSGLVGMHEVKPPSLPGTQMRTPRQPNTVHVCTTPSSTRPLQLSSRPLHTSGIELTGMHAVNKPPSVPEFGTHARAPEQPLMVQSSDRFSSLMPLQSSSCPLQVSAIGRTPPSHPPQREFAHTRLPCRQAPIVEPHGCTPPVTHSGGLYSSPSSALVQPGSSGKSMSPSLSLSRPSPHTFAGSGSSRSPRTPPSIGSSLTTCSSPSAEFKLRA